MKITKFGHACLYIQEGGANILLDPGMYSEGFEDLKGVDAVIVTHRHADHIATETLAKVRLNNPNVAVYADEGTARMLADDPGIKAVHAGDNFEVKGVKVAVYGVEHAVIYPSLPMTENVGYLVAERLFYPGDSFTNPGVPVEILALPLGAPWLKVSEVIDYLLEVKPKVAIPVHDAVLAMPGMHTDMVNKITEPQGIKLTVVPNGESAEF